MEPARVCPVYRIIIQAGEKCEMWTTWSLVNLGRGCQSAQLDDGSTVDRDRAYPFPKQSCMADPLCKPEESRGMNPACDSSGSSSCFLRSGASSTSVRGPCGPTADLIPVPLGDGDTRSVSLSDHREFSCMQNCDAHEARIFETSVSRILTPTVIMSPSRAT